MNEYLSERIKELRSLYNNTGRVEYKHRYQELLRVREHLVIEQIRSEQDSRQSEGGSYNPMSSHL